jgi:hypothetical protein
LNILLSRTGMLPIYYNKTPCYYDYTYYSTT